MKKWKIMTSLLLSCFIIVGCSTKETTPPQQTVTAFLNAYHDRDNAAIAANSTWKDYDANALQLRKEDYLDQVDQVLQKDVYDKMLAFEHKENKETIQEDKAVVEVTITVYDFEPVLEKGLQAAAKKTEELSKKESISDEEIEKEILTILFTHLNKAELTKNIKVQVNLVKENDKWKVSDDNNALTDALLQNTQSIENIAS